MKATQARMARAGLGISLRVVAGVIGVTPNTISRIENGSDPKTSTLNALRDFYEERGISFMQDGNALGVMLDEAVQSSVDSYEPMKASAQ